jgi:hypothetical protein
MLGDARFDAATRYVAVDGVSRELRARVERLEVTAELATEVGLFLRRRHARLGGTSDQPPWDAAPRPAASRNERQRSPTPRGLRPWTTSRRVATSDPGPASLLHPYGNATEGRLGRSLSTPRTAAPAAHRTSASAYAWTQHSAPARWSHSGPSPIPRLACRADGRTLAPETPASMDTSRLDRPAARESATDRN